VTIDRPGPSRILVFQDPTLFPWATVWNNVATGLDVRDALAAQRSRVDPAPDIVGLCAFANAYPHKLSGGMAQRAALARALVNDPPCCSSMSREAGFTAILVTSDVGEALVLAPRVIVLTERAARIKAEFQVELSLPETPGRSLASRRAMPNPRDSRARRMRPG
jgi:NitT/TauT family transport system ATP-binding protein